MEAIEEVADISHKNGMVAEAVSVATETMNARIEEVTIAASSLNTMAGQLTDIIGGFKLNKEQKQNVSGTIETRDFSEGSARNGLVGSETPSYSREKMLV